MPDALISPSAAAYCLLGLACAVAFIFALRWLDNASQDKRARDLLDDIYPDPDKNTHETPEDVWRRAYAESDGDHASYVKWRRK